LYIEPKQYMSNPQAAIDSLLQRIYPEELRARREKMAEYAGLIDWRNGWGVLVGIIAQIGYARPGIYSYPEMPVLAKQRPSGGHSRPSDSTWTRAPPSHPVRNPPSAKYSPGGCSLRMQQSDCIMRGCVWIDPSFSSSRYVSQFANGRCWPKDSDILPLSPMHSDTHTVALYTKLGSFVLPMPGVNLGSINMSWVWKADDNRTVLFLGPMISDRMIADLKPEHVRFDHMPRVLMIIFADNCGCTLCHTKRPSSRYQADRPCICLGDCWNRAVHTRTCLRVYASVPTVRTSVVPWDCPAGAPNPPAGTDHNRTVVVQRR
jgi:hypothetical protein